MQPTLILPSVKTHPSHLSLRKLTRQTSVMLKPSQYPRHAPPSSAVHRHQAPWSGHPRLWNADDAVLNLFGIPESQITAAMETAGRVKKSLGVG